MKIEQFVMAYKAEQDRIRALLPEGYESLRPVLRINAEIRDNTSTYLEFNTPVESQGKRGWLNIASWDDFVYIREGKAVTFDSPLLTITYTGVGTIGGCPAERDNDGCFYTDGFKAAELIGENKEYCDCSFQWKFSSESAGGISIGEKSVPAIPQEVAVKYEQKDLTAENAAEIPCQQILGSYRVTFEREEE